MSLIPEEELSTKSWVNLTPMVDFLFLVLAIFAVLALTRTSLFDSEIQLAKVKDNQNFSQLCKNDPHTVNLVITEKGQYRWMTEFTEYSMDTVPTILEELSKQKELGFLPEDITKTEILLHIDKNAQWDPILQLVYSLKRVGYSVHPVHEQENSL